MKAEGKTDVVAKTEKKALQKQEMIYKYSRVNNIYQCSLQRMAVSFIFEELGIRQFLFQ